MRDLESDKAMILNKRDSSPLTPPGIWVEDAALHALDRAISAENALKQIRTMLEMDHSDYQKYLIWTLAGGAK